MSPKVERVQCKRCRVLRHCESFAFIFYVSASLCAAFAEENAATVLDYHQKGNTEARDRERNISSSGGKLQTFRDIHPKTTPAFDVGTTKSLPFAAEGTRGSLLPEIPSFPFLSSTDSSKFIINSENSSLTYRKARLEYRFKEETYFDKPVYVTSGVLFDKEPEEMVLGDPGNKNPVKEEFLWEHKLEILRLHNLHRSNASPPASDMFFMEWDENLADVAEQWAKTCHFDHGLPDDYEGEHLGQNLYMGWDPTGVRAMMRWYEEYQDYDLETQYCKPKKQCGHYTQLMWAESKLLGCSMNKCGPGKFYVVCHYYPPGNIAGTPPYQVGKPCSQCKSVDGGLCTNNLCVTREQCNRNEDTCSPSCPLECQNCGGLNKTACRCICPEGWDSLDCSRLCENEHEMCGKTPGFPTPATCGMLRYAVRDKYCRKMCGSCHGFSEDYRLKDSCCSGLRCENGYVIDLERRLCKCRLRCPGPKCYELTEKEESEKTSAGVRHSNLNTCVLISLLTAMNWLLHWVS